MSNGQTRPNHETRPPQPVRGWIQRILRFGGLLCCSAGLALALSGCGGGGGASADPEAGPSTPAAAPATGIDLPPGQTSAVLEWARSRGPVQGYIVLQARNGGAWTFLGRVGLPRVEVRGQPGDEVQIRAVAEGSNGSSSAPSPPSPILRFHAPPAVATPVQAATGATTTSGSFPVAVPLLAPDAGSDAAPEPAPGAGSDPKADGLGANPQTSDRSNSDANSDSNDPSGADRPVPDDPALPALELSTRARLLHADLRFAAHRLSPRAAHWLAERVAAEQTAGVALVGSGQRDADAWSELVWRDAAGQLFVSDGATAATRDDIRETLEETIRLLATERFVGLADLDGDGNGDWLIEDTSTGEVWIIDGVTGETRAARAGMDRATTRLAGYGDFDGDGRNELVWRREDDTLFFSGRTDAGAPPQPIEDLPSLPMEALLTIADFDADGLDDLATRGRDGRLELVLSRPRTGGGIGFETLAGPEPRIEQLDFIASLDLDGDGVSELAWLGEVGLEIWDPRSGPLGELAASDRHDPDEGASQGD